MSQFPVARSIDGRPEAGFLPWLAFAVLECAALSVFWAFDALPFMDLPAHAGTIALRAFYPRSEYLQQYFVVAPHLGAYSLFRFIGDGVAQWIGPMGAVRTLASLPVIAVPAAVLYARQRLYGDCHSFFAYVALILSFGYMTIMGFASYMLAVAVFIVALTEWLVLLATLDTGSDTTRSEIKVACLSVLLFVSHGFVFVVFAFVAGVIALSGGSRISRLLRLRALSPAGLIICYSLWIERTELLPDVPAAALVPRFQGLIDKLSLFATPTLTTRTGVDVAIALLTWLAVVVAAVKSFRASENISNATKGYIRALCIASLTILCVFAMLPHAIGWFGFVDGRLLPLTLLTGLLAINPGAFSARMRSWATHAAGIAAVVTVALMLIASYRFQDEASGYAEVLDAVPENSRLLYFPLEPDSRILVGHPFVHYDKLVLTQRPMIPSDMWFHQGTAIYPTKINPVLKLPANYSSSDLKAIVWPDYSLEDWHYVLIRLYKDSARPETPAALSPVMHRGGWWLYRTFRQLPDRASRAQGAD